ncbi:MAG: hypothetical protein M4D80_13875 [Myxococcota bacterium]|nr:hypothetical protein [Myxococcota bacterium]
MLLVAVGIGLFVRFKCRASKETPPAKPAAVVAQDALTVTPPPLDASEPVADAMVTEPATPATPAYKGPDLSIGALSADRKRALLVPVEGHMAFRVVEIDSKKVETDLELPALSDLEDPASEAVMSDLVRARAVLRDFPLGAHRFGQVASSTDGTLGAFNVGDPLHLVAGDKLGRKVALPAAYDPMITADGTLLFRGYDGRIDDEGKYSLFAMPVAGGKPKKIAGTDGFSGVRAVSSRTSSLRIVVSQPPTIPTCVLDVSLTKPFRVLSKACPEEGKYEGMVELSPAGDFLAWSTEERVRSMELSTKRIDLDTVQAGSLWVSDEGRVVIATESGTVVWEPKRKEVRDSTASIDYRCVWRNANEMVCADGGNVRVVAP